MIKVLESRDGIIYHATKLSNLDKILSSNKLIPSKSRNPLVKPSGVSLTRSYEFARSYFSKPFAIIHLDLNKLSSNYKLIPVTDHPNGMKARVLGHNKAEEIVPTTIENLDRYIVDIETFE